MSYFLWVEDFENLPRVTCEQVFGEVLDEADFSSENRKLVKRNLTDKGVFITFDLQESLEFIKENLNKIDYVILDIDLPAYSEGDDIHESIFKLLERFEDYKKLDDGAVDEESLKTKCNAIRSIAGFYIYTELVVELGFPKQHILFCSNHGDKTRTIQEAFKQAKIELPPIYLKENKAVKEWVKERHENPYSRLRRGIIEGCNYAKGLREEDLRFNDFIRGNDRRIGLMDLFNYIGVLENLLPLQEPKWKTHFYKLFVRTLAHEWDAANNIQRDNQNKTELAWIMKNARHWMAHNSKLFDELNEQTVAYLFLINMRMMFNYQDDELQYYEKILLQLFKKDNEQVLVELNTEDLLSSSSEKPRRSGRGCKRLNFKFFVEIYPVLKSIQNVTSS